MIAAAIALGLVAVTADPVIVGLAVALIAGVALLATPIAIIWIIFGVGLLVAGVLPIWAEGIASRSVWGIAVLGFALMALAAVVAAFNRSATSSTPAFVWITLAFLIFVTANGMLQSDSAHEVGGGFKRYFQATGLAFALAWLPLAESSVRRWVRFFLVVALIQLPWALYQLIHLVPIREAFVLAYPGMVPIDAVGGTFGSSLTGGGGSAEMATFLIIVLAFILSRLREGVLTSRQAAWLIPPVVIPLFLGETKVVVVLLPLMILALYRRELVSRPRFAIAVLLAAGTLTAAAGYAYMSIRNKSLGELFVETLRYSVQDQGHGLYKLNRTRVLTFWVDRQDASNPMPAVLGMGLGTAHELTGSVAARHAGLGIGLTAVSTLLWEHGSFGLLLFLAILLAAWRGADGLRRVDLPAWARADAAAIQAAMPLFAFYLLYRLSMLEALPFQIVFWGMLGYLAWLRRQPVSQTHWGR